MKLLQRTFDFRALKGLGSKRSLSDRLLADLLRVARFFARCELTRLRQPSGATDDVAQEAVLRSWLCANAINSADDRRCEAWFRSIVHHVAVDFARSQAAVRKAESSWPGTLRSNSYSNQGTGFAEGLIPDPAEAPLESLCHEELKLSVRAILGLLPERLRDAVVLWIVDGLSFTSIAERHHVSASTAGREAKEGLRHLRRLLHERQLSLTKKAPEFVTDSEPSFDSHGRNASWPPRHGSVHEPL